MKETSKNIFRRSVMWAALALIILLIFLSIYGAFIGPRRAKMFFNSLPLSFYWPALGFLLVGAFAAFRRLAGVPGLLLMHLGCILILAGAMWGSGAGHKLRKQLFGTDKIPTGRMVIFEGDRETSVTSEDGQSRELRFAVRLKDFRIEHYKPEYLRIETRQGQSWKIPVETGSEFFLGPDLGSITILRSFKNFRITVDGERRTAIDAPAPGSNPALEVELKDPNGSTSIKYVFGRLAGHFHPEEDFLLSYERVVRDYISQIQIIQDGRVVAEKSLEVNRPVHFGGYHFYQHSYDADAGRYTVLMVVSDSGLKLVYGGYLMLCIGVFQHLWLRHILAKLKSKHNGN